MLVLGGMQAVLVHLLGCDMQWIFSLVIVPVVFSLKWILAPPLVNPNAAGHVPHGHREL